MGRGRDGWGEVEGAGARCGAPLRCFAPLLSRARPLIRPRPIRPGVVRVGAWAPVCRTLALPPSLPGIVR